MGRDSKGEGDEGDERKNTLKEHKCRKIRLTNDRRNCRLFFLRKNVKAKKRTRLLFFIPRPRFDASVEEEGVWGPKVLLLCVFLMYVQRTRRHIPQFEKEEGGGWIEGWINLRDSSSSSLNFAKRVGGGGIQIASLTSSSLAPF